MIPSLFTGVTVRQQKSAWLLANSRRFGTIRKAVVIAPLLAVIAILVLPPRWHPASVLAAQQRSFQALGPMPGSCQGCDTYGSGLSPDGSTVVGSAFVCPDGSTTCTSTGKTEAYRWTVANGYQLLGHLNGSFGTSPSATGSAAFAASSDGSVVVGQAPVGSNSFGGFRWTAAGGMQPLPIPPINQAYAVRPDGNFIVGPFGWFNNNTGQSGTFGNTEPASSATAFGVSAVGQIVVGVAGGTAFRWTAASGLQDINPVPGQASDADTISADGNVIVGEFQVPLANNFVYHAFRWTASTGMVDLGTLGGPESRALAVNHYGSVIVGTSFTNQQTTSNHAFRWTAKTGMQDLNKLVSGSVELTFATGVSADGTVIAGHGLANQQGSKFPQTVPYRAVVPVP
jgi:probable HAF family extracellular repeat protein